MKKLILVAATAALGLTAPAGAKPHGHHDNGRHYGQMKHHQRYNRGQRWRTNYGTVYSYNRIPLTVRQRYNLNSRYRYYYNDGYYYAVDPRTMLVQQVIGALLR